MDGKFCFIVLFGLITTSLSAQNPGVAGFWHLTPQHGLSQSTGQAIIQDSEGFMWIGTQDGLNKYDGYEITIYKNSSSDTNSLSNNDVSTLLLDREGNLWIGTLGGGLNLYNKETDDFTIYDANGEQPELGIGESSVFDLFEDSNGNIWIGTEGGLSKKKPGEEKFTHYTSKRDDPTTLSSSNIQAIYEDNRGYLWVGTRYGLNRMDPETGTFTRYFHDESDPASIGTNRITVVYEDAQNNLWIGGERGGLNKYNYESDDFERYVHDPSDPYSISDNFLMSIFEDSNGILWIGTTNGGLNVFDRETERFYHNKADANDPTGLNNNSIYSLYENDDKILWVGTFTGGISLLDLKEPRFQHFEQNPFRSDALQNSSILSFLEDSSGNFWVGSDGDNGGGLSKVEFKDNSIQAVNYSHDPLNLNSLPSDVVLQLLNASDEEIWIGTYRGGVSKFNYVQDNFTHYPFDDFGNKHDNSDVYALYTDSDGNLWAGTNGGGVQVLKKGAEKFIPVQEPPRDDGLAMDFIRAFFEDSNGNLWIGTYGSGLVLLERDTQDFTFFTDENSSINNGVIFSIYEDSKNRLWVGTKGGGLNLYNKDDQEFTHYTEEDGLPNNIINGILEDDAGNLWLSTNNGISRFNPDSLEFANFGVSDGLQDIEFIVKSAYKDSKGFMYFGGINGFNRFNPENIIADTNTYPVKITDFQIFNSSVKAGKDSPLQAHITQAESITLSHKISVFTFRYAALNYNVNKGSEYAYKLEGFDVNWNYVGSKRTATYTNLDPGEYTFKVKVANKDDFWNPDIASVNLIITPPFWQTTWFYLIAGISVIGFIIGGFRYRTRQITQQNKLLEQEVASRTSELRESNQDLKQALQDLEETREELVQNAHKAGMADIATGVLHNIGNVLNSVTTSTSLTGEVLKKSKLEKLFKANELLREHKDNLEEFLTEDPQGQKLAKYFLKLDESLKSELQVLKKHNQRLEQKVQVINNVIAAQQTYARVGFNEESTNLKLVVEDTLTIFGDTMERHSVTLRKEMEHTDPVYVQKTKLVHVILNILKNAKDAIVESGASERKISIRLYQENQEVFLEISDNGTGIKKEYENQIFTHGFTTKKDGHGFGLHSSANYMTEMGGKIKARNNEEGDGATFILSFPVRAGNEFNTKISADKANS